MRSDFPDNVDRIDSAQFCQEISSDSDSDSKYDIVLMSTEDSVGHKNYWITDSGATCHM